MNSQLEKLFGRQRDELLGRPIEVLMPDRYRDAHPKKFETFLRSPQTRPMASGLELWGRCKDGREIRVEISLSPVDTEDGQLMSATIRETQNR